MNEAKLIAEVAVLTEIVRAQAKRIAEMEALAQQYVDRFCDANCTWSDHHPDCKYGTQNSDELTVAYMSGLYDGKKQAKPEQEPDWLDKDQTETDWDYVWLLIKAASYASSKGFISGTTNWGSAVSRYIRNESPQPAPVVKPHEKEPPTTLRRTHEHSKPT